MGSCASWLSSIVGAPTLEMAFASGGLCTILAGLSMGAIRTQLALRLRPACSWEFQRESGCPASRTAQSAWPRRMPDAPSPHRVERHGCRSAIGPVGHACLRLAIPGTVHRRSRFHSRAFIERFEVRVEDDG